MKTYIRHALSLTPLVSFALRNARLVERLREQNHFCRASLLRGTPEKASTMSFAPTPRLGLPTFGPLFAETYMPPMKHSFQRNFCLSLSWSRKARHKSKSVPASAHSPRDGRPILSLIVAGNSLHGAPVHRIQRMDALKAFAITDGRTAALWVTLSAWQQWFNSFPLFTGGCTPSHRVCQSLLWLG